MDYRAPITELPTHSVSNQTPPLINYNLYRSDPALQAAIDRFGASWADERLAAFGATLGQPEVLQAGHDANRYGPELKLFDATGRRLDEVKFHPAYHHLMEIGLKAGIVSLPWTESRAGGHVAHTALEYMLFQVDGGVCCPITMSYAAAPLLQRYSEIDGPWLEKLTCPDYDPRFLPVSEKKAVTIGMAMTEKQGGSDVRANTTRATALGKPGQGQAYHLFGHKWFCSAPMSDAFFTLAYTENGLSCFFVPRWQPDGQRNPFFIQRLKDKLGNRSNASAEIEYNRTWAQMVGEEGRGVATIIEMVHHTRLDTSMAPAAMMRQAFVQALHHARHRTAFQRHLVDQPLMRNVLCDMAIESEAALLLVMRVAQAYDQASHDPAAASFARLAVAVVKYWLNKRVVPHVFEAMECLGGGGYVEESLMPRLYREAPLNSIWEGSGNIICLDILRTLQRDETALQAFLAEIDAGASNDTGIKQTLDAIKAMLASGAYLEWQARQLVEKMAIALAASLLRRYAPQAVADAYCAARMTMPGQVLGSLPHGLDTDTILDRSLNGSAV